MSPGRPPGAPVSAAATLALCLGLAGLFLLPPAPALAHQTAASQLIGHVRPGEQEVDVLLVVSAYDLAEHLRLEDPAGLTGEPRLKTYLERRVGVLNAGEPCPPDPERGFLQYGSPPTHLVYRAVLVCEAPLSELTFHNTVMVDTLGGYRHFGRIQLGEAIHTTVFDMAFPTYDLKVAGEGEVQAAQSVPEMMVRYGWQGVLHIVLGFDHVLFVLVLLLTARRFRDLALIVTSFTIAHSVTLTTSALDLFTLSPGIVEPIIAISIAYIAIENIRRPEGPRHRLAVTFGFGLIHGFGFSYVLRDELGLPTDALLPALFSFNVGVELGQLAIVAVAFPLVTWAMKRGWYRRFLVVASGAIVLLSGFWLVDRIIEFYVA
jgi:hydrogenase/urease accessory protein HupE